MFCEEDQSLIKRCADTVHSIENGTANRSQIEEYINDSYTFVDIDEDRVISAPSLREGVRGDYYDIIKKLKLLNPDVDEDYIPFMVADVLKNVYESEEIKNV